MPHIRTAVHVIRSVLFTTNQAYAPVRFSGTTSIRPPIAARWRSPKRRLWPQRKRAGRSAIRPVRTASCSRSYATRPRKTTNWRRCGRCSTQNFSRPTRTRSQGFRVPPSHARDRRWPSIVMHGGRAGDHGVDAPRTSRRQSDPVSSLSGTRVTFLSVIYTTTAEYGCYGKSVLLGIRPEVCGTLAAQCEISHDWVTRIVPKRRAMIGG